jgi:uncharacterized membrane protein YqjE
MTDSSQTRTNIFALLAVLTLSAVTMLWLFWHYPVSTGIATIAVLTILGVSARLAGSTDSEGIFDRERSEIDQGEHSVSR